MLSLWLLACAPPPLDTGDPVDTSPSIRITWPPPESEVVGCETVAVEVENFKLVDFATAPTDEIPEDEGHYHIYHPDGYVACFKPYCLVDFSAVTSTTEPYFTAVLAHNDHSEVTDADGARIEFILPIVFTPGDCPGGGGGSDTGEY